MAKLSIPNIIKEVSFNIFRDLLDAQTKNTHVPEDRIDEFFSMHIDYAAGYHKVKLSEKQRAAIYSSVTDMWVRLDAYEAEQLAASETAPPDAQETTQIQSSTSPQEKVSDDAPRLGSTCHQSKEREDCVQSCTKRCGSKKEALDN